MDEVKALGSSKLSKLLLWLWLTYKFLFTAAFRRLFELKAGCPTVTSVARISMAFYEFVSFGVSGFIERYNAIDIHTRTRGVIQAKI